MKYLMILLFVGCATSDPLLCSGRINPDRTFLMKCQTESQWLDDYNVPR